MSDRIEIDLQTFVEKVEKGFRDAAQAVIDARVDASRSLMSVTSLVAGLLVSEGITSREEFADSLAALAGVEGEPGYLSDLDAMAKSIRVIFPGGGLSVIDGGKPN